MENIKGNPYRGQSAHCADEWHVGSRLAGGRTCAENLDAAAEIQGVWFRGVGSSSHICSFCHASRPKTSEPKASICTGQVFSRKSETFSQASEHHLTRLNTSSSDFVALVYLEYLAARVGGTCQRESGYVKASHQFLYRCPLSRASWPHCAHCEFGWMQFGHGNSVGMSLPSIEMPSR